MLRTALIAAALIWVGSLPPAQAESAAQQEPVTYDLKPLFDFLDFLDK
jgi:hypothetical protein